MEITKKEIMIGAGAIVFVIIVVAIGFWIHGAATSSTNPAAQPADSLNRAHPTSSIPTTPGTPTVSAVPASAVAPNAGATNAPSSVAVPVVQSAGDPSGNVSYRSFNISISGGVYSPSTVIVKQGDTVNLEMTAVDANYGFTQPDYGMDGLIAKGKTVTIQFQALHTGDFTFYCASCGGPLKGPTGHLIVTAN